MIIKDFPHKGRVDTGKKMYWLASNFAGDLGTRANLPYQRYWDMVRRIPYRSDPELLKNPNWEVLARPGYLLDLPQFASMDCKKKAILLGAWAQKNRVPYRWVAMSEKADGEIHHVFPVMLFGDGWVNMDATYPHYRIGEPKPRLTAAEFLPR
jgi:hypothetical protein